MTVRAGKIAAGAQQARAWTHNRRPRSREPKTKRLTQRPLMPPRSRGPYRRLARQLREAHLRACSLKEVEQLQMVQAAVLNESLCVFEAQEIVRGVIRGQLERHRKEAA